MIEGGGMVKVIRTMGTRLPVILERTLSLSKCDQKSRIQYSVAVFSTN